MKYYVIDIETFYDSKAGYSLSKMQTDAYVLDPRFQVIGVGFKADDGYAKWIPNDETDQPMRDFFSSVDWSNAAVCCHNTLFDGFILTQRYGVRPKLWMDTLAMARMLYPWLKSHSLAALSELHGLPAKGTEVAKNDGKRLADFNPTGLEEYGEYCIGDVENTCALMHLYLPRCPTLELRLIDMTIRMFTEPGFVGDIEEMERLYKEEVARKALLLDEGKVSKDIIMSNNLFAAELLARGCEPPMKVSERTKKLTYAFAKSDKEFTALLEHENPEVQALVAARLGVKTTIAETRALKFLEMSRRGPLPVYSNFWGAKATGRHTGGNYANWLNLPARGPSAGLRNAVKAPEGCKIIVGDSANIELRTAMAGAGQTDVLEKIAAFDELARQGIRDNDLYCEFASKLFGFTVTKAHKLERQVGKIAMLSLQYGAGWAKFIEMVRIQAQHTLDEQAARRVVDLYRTVHGRIPMFWSHCNDFILPALFNGRGTEMLPVDVNAWCITSDDGFGILGAPGVVYKDLHKNKEGDWVYTMGNDAHVKIYGGKVVENWSQHVARGIVMWQAARINERYPVKLTVYDEAVAVVADEEVDDAVAYFNECLSMAPPWCAGKIPLACEVGVGQSYGEAKS